MMTMKCKCKCKSWCQLTSTWIKQWCQLTSTIDIHLNEAVVSYFRISGWLVVKELLCIYLRKYKRAHMRVFTNKHMHTNDYLCEYDVQPHTQSHTVKRGHTHAHTHTHTHKEPLHIVSTTSYTHTQHLGLHDHMVTCTHAHTINPR